MLTKEKILPAGLILLLATAPFLSGTFELRGVTPLRLGALFLVTLLFLVWPLNLRPREWKPAAVIFMSLATLFIWGGLSLIYSAERLEAFQVLLSWGYYFSLFFLAYMLFQDSLYFKRAAQIFLGATVLLCLYGLYQHYFAYEAILKKVLADPQKHGGLRIAYMWPLFTRQIISTYMNSNSLALHLALSIILALGLWGEKKLPARQVPLREILLFMFYPLFIALALYCLLLTGSRGGWLAAALGSFLVVLFSGIRSLKERKFQLLIFGLVVLAVVGYRSLTYQGATETRPAAQMSSLASPAKAMKSRTSYYGAAWEMFKEKPWQGWGLGSFGTVYHRFRQEGAEYARFAHSFPIQLAAETGIIGLALWLSFLGGMAVLLSKGISGLRQQWEPARSAMLGSAMLILFFHSLLDIDLEVVGLATFFWVGLGTLVGVLTGKDPIEAPPLEPPLWQKQLYVLPFALLTAFFILIPFWAQTLAQEGQNYLESHKTAKAIDAFKHSLQINPYDAYVHASLSRAYQEQYQKNPENLNLLEESQEAIEKALSLSPQNFSYHSSLGWIFWLKALKNQEFIDDAEGQFLKAAHLAPQSLTVHRDLSLFYQTFNREEEAQKELALVEKLEAREKALIQRLEEMLRRQKNSRQ